MKIQVDKTFLPDGRHLVEITHVEEGVSEHKNVPFFACRFENEEGFIMQRFYNSTPGMPVIMKLFQAVDIPVKEGKDLDTNQLLQKKLYITVGERTYNEPESGNERTLKQAIEFESASQQSGR